MTRSRPRARRLRFYLSPRAAHHVACGIREIIMRSRMQAAYLLPKNELPVAEVEDMAAAFNWAFLMAHALRDTFEEESFGQYVAQFSPGYRAMHAVVERMRGKTGTDATPEECAAIQDGLEAVQVFAELQTKDSPMLCTEVYLLMLRIACTDHLPEEFSKGWVLGQLETVRRELRAFDVKSRDLAGKYPIRFLTSILDVYP